LESAVGEIEDDYLLFDCPGECSKTPLRSVFLSICHTTNQTSGLFPIDPVILLAVIAKRETYYPLQWCFIIL